MPTTPAVRTSATLGVLVFVLLAGSVQAQTATTSRVESMQLDGVEREWRLYVPPSYDAGTPTPLVLDFHGSGGSPDRQAALSRFEALGAEEGFLVATPAGAYRRPDDGSVSWNVYQDPAGPDDVQFVRELIAWVGRRYSVDPARIYAAGFSGGARMSSRVGCGVSDLVAAVAPVAGLQFPSGCRPSRPMPVLTFHGRQDRVNHYAHQPDSPPYWDRGVEDAVADWVRHNGCTAASTEEPVNAAVARLSYQDCRGGADVVFYRSEEAGHTWPGAMRAGAAAGRGPAPTGWDIPATRLIWEFFEAHPLR